MKRSDFVLAVMAASDGAIHTPVQVQKLFFLVDRKVALHVGGPYFHFRPDDYGPFDAAVYQELEELASAGRAIVERCDATPRKTFRLTVQGQREGEENLKTLDPAVAKYIRELSAWVRAQSFAGLVSSVYAEYPEMKVNSVFRG